MRISKNIRAFELDLEVLREIGMIMRTEILWYKQTMGRRTAWGSWKAPSNPHIVPSWEYVLVFCKDSWTLESDSKDADIDGNGVINGEDAFPRDPSETLDTDGDTTGNNADPDNDGDGWNDTLEQSFGTNPLDKMSVPLEGGATDGAAISERVVEEAKALYYQMVGWDEGGRPTRAKLAELGLDWLAEGS